MTLFLLISAIILIACVIGSKLSTRFGVPTLVFFIGLGMLFGSDGLFKIHFEDYSLAEKSVLPLSFSSCFMVALVPNGKLLDL